MFTKSRVILASLLAFAPVFIGADLASANCVNPGQEAAVAAAQQASSSEPVVVEINTCGGDDTSYQVPLSVDVTFDGRTFDSVYATTNSVITFGAPDGTYWDYPQTPSISLYSFDWVVYPQWRNDEHLIIRSSDGGFQVDISARPIWLQNATEPTHIVITAAILSDGTVAMAYTLSGPEYPQYNPRTGVRLNNGSIVDFETYGIEETEETPELAPEPTEEAPFTPEPEPTPEPTPTPTEDVDREPTPDNSSTVNRPYVPEGATVAQEGSVVEVVAPEGQRIASAVGYYGDPNDSTRGGEVSSILFGLLAGQTSATVEVSNQTFQTDPAPGTPKVLILLITFENIPVVEPTPEPSPSEPAISPTPEVTPEPSPSENPSPTPSPEPQPQPEPSPEPTPVPVDPEPVAPEPEPSIPEVPEPESSLEPEPELTTEPQPEETEAPEVQPIEPEEPSPSEPTPTEPEETIEPEEEPITSAEELPEELSPEQLMEVDLTQIVATDLSEAQVEALVEAALETFETAEQGSPEYEQALDALYLVAQADDIVLDEALAAIPLLGDVLGGAVELFNSLGNAGSDMSPQVRETSEKTIVAAVIVAQIALSAVSMAGIATTVNIRNGA